MPSFSHSLMYNTECARPSIQCLVAEVLALVMVVGMTNAGGGDSSAQGMCNVARSRHRLEPSELESQPCHRSKARRRRSGKRADLLPNSLCSALRPLLQSRTRWLRAQWDIRRATRAGEELLASVTMHISVATFRSHIPSRPPRAS